MNKKIMIVLGGAVLVAVLVALLVQVTLGGKKQVAGAEEKVLVLVADKELAIGKELGDGDLRWHAWPKSGLFPGAVLQAKPDQKPLEAVSGRLARKIAKDEPLAKSALLVKGKGNVVAAGLESGKRALAIEVSASKMVGGFIGPGDYVDVILTYKSTIRTNDDDPRVQKMLALNLDKLATETILQNVKVLAVDQVADRPDDAKIKVGKTVTLAVNTQDSERLALAAELGDLTLALRGIGDEARVEKKWDTVSDKRLTSVVGEIYKQYDKIKKEDSINSNSVRIYSGEQLTVTPAH